MLVSLDFDRVLSESPRSSDSDTNFKVHLPMEYPLVLWGEQCKRKLCDTSKQKASIQCLYWPFSSFILMRVYLIACGADCQSCHMQPCSTCEKPLSVASKVLQEGYVVLSETFRSAFPNQKYMSTVALQQFLQMPLAAVRVGTPQSGKSSWFLLEYNEGVHYTSLAIFLETMLAAKTTSKTIGLDKAKVKSLLGLARSYRERELIRYSVFKSSRLTLTGARRCFGLERMPESVEEVEEFIKAAYSIRQAIDKLSRPQDKALLSSLELKECELDSAIESECEDESTHCLHSVSGEGFNALHKELVSGEYNWFAVVVFLEQQDAQ